MSATECGSCGYEVTGYSKKELSSEGWRWYDAGKGRSFVLCDECVEKYDPVWEAREKAAA